MPHNQEFYRRLIVSCFDRHGSHLPLNKILEDAGLIIGAPEIQEGLKPVLEDMIANGRIVSDRRRKDLYCLVQRN